MGHKTTDTSGTSNQTMTGTTTPTNPSWVDSLVSGVGGNVGALAGMNPSSFVAPINSTLGTANAGALNLSGSPTSYDGAIGGAAGVMNQAGPDIASNLSKFMNPYLSQVVGATSNDLSQSEGKTRAQQSLTLARNGAFGGSGAALTQSATEGELARARATSIGDLLSHGYDTALSGATSQGQLDSQTEAQRLAAANSIGSLATQQQQTARDNITTQGGIGAILQTLQQQQAAAPLSTAGSLSDILSKLPLNLFHGDSTTGTSTGATTGTSAQSGASLGDWLAYLSSNARAAASAGGG